MQSKTYAVVDLETTGHSSIKGDRIIQIAIVFVRDGKIVDQYMQFINPERTIPAFIQQLTNIHTTLVQDAPTFEQVASTIREQLEGTIFVAHNIDFDLSFLQAEFSRCGIEAWSGLTIDTVEFTKIMFPTFSSYRLQDLSEQLAIPLHAAHRADDDALATSKILQACFTKLADLPIRTLQKIHEKSFLLKSHLSHVFYEAIQKKRTLPKETDFVYFREIPLRQPLPMAEKIQEPLIYPTSDREKERLLLECFPTFEHRQAQNDFMDVTYEALQEGKEVAVEVPTGVGKTIAYLIPSSIQAVNTAAPIVISTYTNQLADRIEQREIPAVEGILKRQLTTTVVKGREQYISLRKFEELFRLTTNQYDEQFVIMQILVWLTETETGDLNELAVSGGGELFLHRVRNNQSALLPEERSVDFYQRMLRQCQQSTVIITNHAWLASNLKRVSTILPTVSGLIIDEAHQFAKIAIESENTQFTYANWRYTLGQLSSWGEGQLPTLVERLLDQYANGTTEIQRIQYLYERFISRFDQLMPMISQLAPVNGSTKVSYLLERTAHFNQQLAEVTDFLYDYIDGLVEVEQSLQTIELAFNEKERAIQSEWSYWVRELVVKAGEWVQLFEQSAADSQAITVSLDRRSLPGSLLISKSPLHMPAAIRQGIQRLIEQSLGVVWTSGTLGISSDERYIAKKLHVPEVVRQYQFTAPPHFYEGAEIYIVNDLPSIQEGANEAFIEAVASAVIETVYATNGRLFVLFTSYDMLRKTYDLIMESEQLASFLVVAQGVTSGSRTKLLKQFSAHSNGVLFGTSSFWEGIDVEGDPLRAVIVVRLPFTPPSDPYHQAIAKRLTKAGENAFLQHALPEAMMRMRQGFGRLIRSNTHHGYFIILDRRIETKSYGELFLDTLPPVPVHRTTLTQMVREIEATYKKRRENHAQLD